MIRQLLVTKGRRSAVLLTVLWLVSACSSAPERPDVEYARAPKPVQASQTLAHAPAPTHSAPEIAPGYEIALSGFNDAKLDTRFRIAFDGILTLPYQVEIQTEGLSRDQLRQKIVEAFSRFYRTPPNISLAVIALRVWVEVRGLVEKPGRFLVKPDTSLDELVGQAGGLLKTTPPKFVRFQQTGEPPRTISLAEYYAGAPEARVPNWLGGDVIFFQSDRGDDGAPGGVDGATVQILGEVKNPGEYRYVSGADFYYYLAKAGGPTTSSDPRKIEMLRARGLDRTPMRFALLDPSTIPDIRPGDMILLMSDKPTPLERTVPVVAGLVGILNTVLLLILVL